MSVALLFPSSFISDPVCESKRALSPQLIVIFILFFLGWVLMHTFYLGVSHVVLRHTFLCRRCLTLKSVLHLFFFSDLFI